MEKVQNGETNLKIKTEASGKSSSFWLTVALLLFILLTFSADSESAAFRFWGKRFEKNEKFLFGTPSWQESPVRWLGW